MGFIVGTLQSHGRDDGDESWAQSINCNKNGQTPYEFLLHSSQDLGLDAQYPEITRKDWRSKSRTLSSVLAVTHPLLFRASSAVFDFMQTARALSIRMVNRRTCPVDEELLLVSISVASCGDATVADTDLFISTDVAFKSGYLIKYEVG
jgi:hypothetical protein